MAKLPSFWAVRHSDGEAVVIDHRVADLDRYSTDPVRVAKARKRQGHAPLKSAPLDRGEPYEFNGKIG